jgi:formate dehydrogenase gamma subunit
MKSDRTFLRFPVAYRIEHWVMVLSFTALAVTGLVQKYALSAIAIWLIQVMGGLETVRVIHRVAATMLMLEAVYHVGLVGYNLIVRRYGADLMLSWTDIKNAFQSLLYNLGLRGERPLQGRYTFEEKFEYFAIIWGTVVMIVTGIMLWNPIATTALLPGEIVPAAKIVHSGEALLAVLAIIVWHFYHVHIRSFNKSMFTGRMSEAEMKHEHPLELKAMQSGGGTEDPGHPRRRRLFVGIYAVVAVALVVGIYVVITFEDTAIATVEPVETITAYTPPDVPQPVLASFERPMTSWEDGVSAFFEMRCAFCHGGAAPLSGLNLTAYDTALLGGTDLPAIVPNDPENSGIIIQHRDGDHPVMVTDEELARLEAWIAAGAPRE